MDICLAQHNEILFLNMASIVHGIDIRITKHSNTKAGLLQRKKILCWPYIVQGIPSEGIVLG